MSRWVVPLVATAMAVIGVGVALAMFALASDDGTLVLDLDRGDCFVVPDDLGDGAIAEVDTVDCDEPHLAEVFETGNLNPDRDLPYPDDEAQLFARVDRECAAVLARNPALVEQFGIVPVVADEASWDSFRGRYLCVAVPYGGEPVTGSLELSSN